MKKTFQIIIGSILLFSGAFFISLLPQPLNYPTPLVIALFSMFGGYFIFTPLILNQHTKQLFFGFTLMSITVQLLWLFMPAFFNDFFRYLWDGTMSVHGINPFQYFPFAIAEHTDPSLRSLGSVWYWDLLFFKWTHTIYGPTAQYMFAFAAIIQAGNPLILKSLFFLCNIGSFILGTRILSKLNKSKNFIFLLFLHPLFLFETMATAHIESIYIFCLFFTLYAYICQKQFFTGVGLALLTLTKFFPLLFWPLFVLQKKNVLKGFWERKYLVLTTLIFVMILYFPFFFRLDSPTLLFESFRAFSKNWVMSPGIFFLLWKFFSYETTKLMLTGITILCTFWSYYRYTKHKNIFQAIYEITLWFILFSSVIFSWYVLWLLCLVPFIKNKWPAIILSASILIQYQLIYFDNVEHFTYKYIANGLVFSNQLIIWIPFLLVFFFRWIKKT